MALQFDPTRENQELVDLGRQSCLYSRVTRRGSVLQKVRDKSDGIARSSWSENLGEGVRLDLGELVLHVLVGGIRCVHPSAEVSRVKAASSELTLGFIVLI